MQDNSSSSWLFYCNSSIQKFYLAMIFLDHLVSSSKAVSWIMLKLPLQSKKGFIAGGCSQSVMFHVADLKKQTKQKQIGGVKWRFLNGVMNRNLFFLVPLTGRADFRQGLPTYLTEWQWLSALLFSPYSHFPVCWWILTPRHCFGGRPETVVHNMVLMLQLGWGTVLMFLMEVLSQHRTLLCSGSCKTQQNFFVLMINVFMKPPGVVL